MGVETGHAVKQEGVRNPETGEYDEAALEVEFSDELADSEQYAYKFRDGELWSRKTDEDGRRYETPMSQEYTGEALDNYLAAMAALEGGQTEHHTEARWAPADTSEAQAFSVLKFELREDGRVEISSELEFRELEPEADDFAEPFFAEPDLAVKPAVIPMDRTGITEGKPAETESPILIKNTAESKSAEAKSWWEQATLVQPKQPAEPISLIEFLENKPQPRPEPKAQPLAATFAPEVVTAEIPKSETSIPEIAKPEASFPDTPAVKDLVPEQSSSPVVAETFPAKSEVYSAPPAAEAAPPAAESVAQPDESIAGSGPEPAGPLPDGLEPGGGMAVVSKPPPLISPLQSPSWRLH